MYRPRRQLSSCISLAVLFTLVLSTACGTDAASGDDDDDGAATAADAGAVPESVTGWISVIETNDTCHQWYLRTDWYGGVRAYFAEEFTHQRSLPFHTDFLTKLDGSGSCALYSSNLLPDDFQGDASGMDAFSFVDFDCASSGSDNGGSGYGQTWCEQDQECRQNRTLAEGGECVALPAHSNAGTIALSGLSANLTLTADELDRYYPSAAAPEDLFSPGDTITATAAGGAIAAFTVSSPGVTHLELVGGGLDFANGDYTLEWTPRDEDARVLVAIRTGAHDPNPIIDMILCDVPDSDGKLVIPKDYVEHLASAGEMFLAQKCNQVIRYRRTTSSDGLVELFVGSARNLGVTFPTSS